ncbi:MAG: ABC-F family ATP-binding cassette domain-containing protein [Planctomycetes bacterium]|nr:ABC-F family ATP-binding cassette domain-containing protein [Planctomycetota bacterium]
MPLVTATNIVHRYGTDIILEGVSITIEPGDRVGMVGRNGCGKSTLLKIMSEIIKPDGGTITIQRGSRVGYLKQDPDLDPTETLKDAAEGAFDTLHALHREMHDVYDAMATAKGDDLARLMKKQATLEAQIEAAGGYAIDHKIEEVLHGLGFTDAQFSLPVAKLSGGQKGRLALARLLLENPDVLLLDEPTNHLDIEGRIWLEEFLNHEYRGAVVMVSHDRYLLDNVVNKIVEIEQGRLIDYPGNYAKFRELRVERRTVMLRAYESQQDKIRQEEAYIRRYKAGQRARQAKGRETRLEREKAEGLLEKPMEMAVFTIRLPAAERSGDITASARGLSKSYEAEDGTTKVLFHDLDLVVERGERWGIIGPNGAGKTTLVRCLLGEIPADAGVVRIGANVKVGYYRQTHDGLDVNQSVYRYLQGVILKEAPTQAMSEQQARDLAGAFLFTGDEQEKQLWQLSGGERSRAVLAGLLASAKNLIVLDEPTNHLDIPSAERLEDALGSEGGYEGTMLLISHDRALIDHTCDHLLILDGHGNAEIFAGSYTEWKRKDESRKREAARAAEAEKAKKETAERQRREAEERKKAAAKPKAPTTNKLARLTTEQIEAQIEKIQNRIKQIDQDMMSGDTWRDARKSNQLSAERAKLMSELEPLEFEWASRAENT